MNSQAITSPHNPKYRRWLSLLESKGIKKEGLALVSGEKLVREIMEQQPSLIQEVVLPPKLEWEFAIPKAYRVTAPMFKSLDILGTHFALVVVKAPPLAEWEPDMAPQGLELIVALQDPSNLGALLRSSEAFGVARVILTKECASPYLPKALKAASLSTFRIKMAATPLALDDLRLPQATAFALDMQGQPIATFQTPKDMYLVLGEEGIGLPGSLEYIKRLSIPMQGKTESLNATVAASIALFALTSQKNV